MINRLINVLSPATVQLEFSVNQPEAKPEEESFLTLRFIMK